MKLERNKRNILYNEQLLFSAESLNCGKWQFTFPTISLLSVKKLQTSARNILLSDELEELKVTTHQKRYQKSFQCDIEKCFVLENKLLGICFLKK